MSFELTERARIEADKVNKEPQIVLEITGLDTKFGAVTLKKYIRIGDDNLYIGDSWVIGGLNEIEDSSPYITFSRGTSSRIQQSIDQDKGETSTVTSMSITVIDKNQEVTAILKPDAAQSPTFDLLGRSCKVWLGFKESGWKEDYIVIFRGFIESYKASTGYVTFNLNSVDKIVDSTILPKVSVELSASISNSATEIPLSPSGQIAEIIDSSVSTAFGAVTGLSTYIRVDDEIILVGDVGSTSLTSCTRAQLGTSAVTHDSGASVETIYEIQGKPMDIAKRLLLGNETTLSGANVANNYISSSGLMTSFVRINSSRTETNGIYFRGLNLKLDYGINIGDYVGTFFTINPENDISSYVISDIEITDDGSTILYLDDNTFTSTPAVFVEEEPPASAIIIVSAADSLQWPIGLNLSPDLVDVDQLNKLQARFFNSHYMSFYVKDSMNVREFIEQDLFRPLSLYRVPRNGKFSAKYHFPPLPDEEIVTLDSTNIVNPSSLAIERSTSQNFYNTIVFRYNENVLEDDKFESGYVTTQETSKARIAVGRKALIMDAKGFRTDKTVEGNSTAGASYASTAADRRLDKYAFGAEYIKGIKVNFKTGYTLDIGDIININLTDLKISDIKSGTRSGDARLFEIENKTLDIRTGEISIDVVDTNFNLSARYGLMSPASLVKTGVSSTQFVIKPRTLQPTRQYGSNEYRKWSNKVGASVLVRNDDFSVSGVSTIQSVSNNTITLTSSLGFTPAEDYTFELSKFANQGSLITNLYGFMNQSATGTMSDGSAYYQMV